MNRKLPESEERYQIALQILRKLKGQKLINDSELECARLELYARYQPYITRLIERKQLAINAKQSDVCRSTERSGQHAKSN